MDKTKYVNILKDILNDERLELYRGGVYKKIRKKLNGLNLKEKKVIIFPFGRIGRLVDLVLEDEMQITPYYICDNQLCIDNQEIKPLSVMEGLEKDSYFVLLCSDLKEIYSEIRGQLLRYVSFDHIIDVLSPSLFFDRNNYYQAPTVPKNSEEYPRLAALEYAAREIYKNGVEGDVAEVGVYKGGFAGYINKYLPDRTIHLFDTFSGFDNRDIDEKEESWSADFRAVWNAVDGSVGETLDQIGYSTNAQIYKGYFPDTTKGIEERKYAFVSLDTDLYKPIFAGLQYFYPRLSPGGYIFVDDFGHEKLKGVRMAVIDYCKQNNIGYVSIYDGVDATAIITKAL